MISTGVCVSDEGSVGEDEREYKRPNPIRKKLKRSVKSKNKSSKHFSSLVCYTIGSYSIA